MARERKEKAEKPEEKLDIKNMLQGKRILVFCTEEGLTQSLDYSLRKQAGADAAIWDLDVTAPQATQEIAKIIKEEEGLDAIVLIHPGITNNPDAMQACEIIIEQVGKQVPVFIDDHALPSVKDHKVLIDTLTGKGGYYIEEIGSPRAVITAIHTVLKGGREVEKA